MKYTEIKTFSNSMIKAIARLGKKSEREEAGEFVVEGEKLVCEAEKSGVKIIRVLFDLAKKQQFSGILERLADKGVQLFGCEAEIFQKAAVTTTPQGILAVCKLDEKSNELTVSAIKQGGKYIVLQSIQDPGNAGTIVRTAEAFGLDGVVFTEATVDIYHMKFLRATMGSSFRMPVYFCERCIDAVHMFEDKGVHVYATALFPGAVSIKDVDITKNAAVIIGNEGNGISREIAENTDCIIIPMTGKVNSLNAAIAASVVMWQMQ